MTRTSLDSEGRVSIPEEVRERLQLAEGAEFEVKTEGTTIELHYHRPEIERVRADHNRGEQESPEAGEALFSAARTDVTAPSGPVDAIAGTLSDTDHDSVSLQKSIGERRCRRFDAKGERDENQP